MTNINTVSPELRQYQTLSGYDIISDTWKVVTDFTDYKYPVNKNLYRFEFNIPQGCTKLELADILEQQIKKLRNENN